MHNYVPITVFSQLMSMTQQSNYKGFSSQTYSFFHSAGHYVVAHNSVLPDPTMTVDNVTRIFNKIGDKWEEVVGELGLGIPKSLLDEIQRRYSTDSEKIHACIDYYVNCHPSASWEHLTWSLYWKKEFAAARKSKSFMSTGK